MKKFFHQDLEWLEEARKYYTYMYYKNNDTGHGVKHIEEVEHNYVELIEAKGAVMSSLNAELESLEDYSYYEMVVGSYIQGLENITDSVKKAGIIIKAVVIYRLDTCVIYPKGCDCEDYIMSTPIDETIPQIRGIIEKCVLCHKITDTTVIELVRNVTTEQLTKLIKYNIDLIRNEDWYKIKAVNIKEKRIVKNEKEYNKEIVSNA